MELLKIDLGRGEQMYVDAVGVDAEGRAMPAAAARPVPAEEAVENLKSAVGLLSGFGESFVQAARKLQAAEATLKLGLGFTAEGHVFVAKTGGAINFEVTFSWKNLGTPGTTAGHG
jgi:hypothetical protein